MRTPIIAGNWKMNNNIKEGLSLVREIKGQDLEEDVDTIIENLETYKELTNNIIDIVNNRVGDKTNQITTILTIWSTIFLPITFLTGVFGMNFKYMDALEWEFAFPLFWIISIAIVIIMIIFFRKKKWF